MVSLVTFFCGYGCDRIFYIYFGYGYDIGQRKIMKIGFGCIQTKIGYEYRYPYQCFKKIRIRLIRMFSHPYPSLILHDQLLELLSEIPRDFVCNVWRALMKKIQLTCGCILSRYFLIQSKICGPCSNLSGCVILVPKRF